MSLVTIWVLSQLDFFTIWFLSQLVFCYFALFCHNLCFVTLWVKSQYEFSNYLSIVTIRFFHNLIFVTTCILLGFVTIYVLLHFMYCHHFFLQHWWFIVSCVSSQFVFHCNSCLIKFCVLSRFVSHFNLYFITICVSSQFVLHH